VLDEMRLPKDRERVRDEKDATDPKCIFGVDEPT
jgi:hypothetical protein